MKTPPITLYLIGFAGTGKYTIAKEIAKAGYRIVDNQLINNPIFSLLGLDGVTPVSKEAWAAIAKIRLAVLDYISQDFMSSYVLTNELEDNEGDRKIYGQVKATAEKRGSLFISVKLLISSEERKRRITNPERLSRFKTTNSSEVKKDLIKIDCPYLMEIDVTDLSPAEAARTILNFVGTLKNDI